MPKENNVIAILHAKLKKHEMRKWFVTKVANKFFAGVDANLVTLSPINASENFMLFCNAIFRDNFGHIL